MVLDWLTRSLGRWLDKRFRLARFVRRALNHVFPDHWSFMLGEIALYSFVILFVTGVFLAMFYTSGSEKVVYHGSYHPLDGIKLAAAYESVLHISFDVRAGLLIRQMHHWAALIFIAAITVHAIRIFFTSAYRRPRELNWMIGLTLLLLALANGFFGYSLPGDLLSGAGMRIGYAILLSVPVVGEWMAFLFFGSTVPAAATLPRFYSFHIFLVPALIAILLFAHIGLIWRQMHTNYPGPRRTDKTIVGSRLWPSYAAKSLGLFFLLFAVIGMLGGLVQIDPVWIYGPFDPVAIMPGAQPDWYLGWIEGAMRLFPSIHVRVGGWLVPEIFFPAMLLPLIVFGVLFLYPFFDKLISSDFTDQPHHVLRLPRQQPFNTAFGSAALVFLLVLFVAGGDDVIAVATGSSVVMIRAVLRVLALGAPPVTAVLVYGLCARARKRHAAEDARPALEVAIPERGSTPQTSKEASARCD